MKFKGSGSKGTRVIERKRFSLFGSLWPWIWIKGYSSYWAETKCDRRTDGLTDRRTRQKQYVSPGGGRHNSFVLIYIFKNNTKCRSNKRPWYVFIVQWSHDHVCYQASLRQHEEERSKKQIMKDHGYRGAYSLSKHKSVKCSISAKYTEH